MTTSGNPSPNYIALLPPTGDPQMHSYYTFIALDLARDRAREADQWRLAAPAREGRESSTRRSLAVLLAALSRLSASAARRLDECVADDLAETFRPETLATSR
jgi:hypothetical protein